MTFLSRVRYILTVAMLIGVHATAEPTHFWDEIPVSQSTTPPESIRDNYWHGQFERVNREVAKAEGTELIFFGDSITWKWTLGNADGLEVWKEHYGRYHPINMGNSGDITPVMLYRITHGNLDFPAGREPKVAVLLCGTNNFVVKQSDGGKVRWDLGPQCPPEDVAAGMRAIAQTFRRRLPRTRVILMGILPGANAEKRAKCRKVNAIESAVVRNPDEVVFLDATDHFLKADGSLDKRLFSDGTHPTEEGYRVWAAAIDPLIEKMMKAPPLDPVEIMLIGDGITEGADSATSYRRYLDGMLRRKGLLIDFVGSRKAHRDGEVEPDSYAYDPDHEGHWGRDSDWLASHASTILADRSPEVAVVQVGSRDIASSDEPTKALEDRILANIDRIIDALRAKNPRVKIVLPKLPPIRGKTDAVRQLNQRIDRYVASHAAEGSPLVSVDPATGFDPTTDLAKDGMLPTSRGARKIANSLSEGIASLLGGG